jgi:NAD(P)H-hydrate epimerase
MSGAAILCGSAGLRSGSGLVFVAVPESIQALVAGGNPCYLTVGLPDDSEGRLRAEAVPKLQTEAQSSQAVVVGPGLGQSAGVAEVVFSLVRDVSGPLLLDADALNQLGEARKQLPLRPGPTILTPHPGEFARVLGCDTATVQADREGLAVQFSREHRVVLVLKGAGTVVTDGQRLYVNTTGNPGMATGGSGDVLSGLLGALLGQGFEPFDACVLGVYLHGWAGDLARDDVSEVCLVANDLIDYLPDAVLLHTEAIR